MSIVAPNSGSTSLAVGWTATLEHPSGDLDIGAYTAWRVDKWTGFDMPDRQVSTVDLAEQHGGFSRGPWLGSRTIACEGRIVEGSLWESEHALRRVMGPPAPWTPDDESYRLVLTRPHSDSEPMAVTVKPRVCQFGHDLFETRKGLLAFLLQWQADDPLLYAVDSDTATISPPTSGVGLSYPITYGITYPTGGAGSQITLTNRGTAYAPIVATFAGPPSGTVTGVRLVNLTTGRELRLENLTLASGQVIVVDTHSAAGGGQTVLYEGSSRYKAKTADSDWLVLAPGSNDLAYYADGSSGSSVTVAAASAW